MFYFFRKFYLGLFYILLLSASITSIDAQVVYEFNSQSDLNQFDQNLTTVDGDIIINGSDIDNLSPLFSIQHITGHLIIGDTVNTLNGNDILENLEGLNNLKTIGKDFRLIGNPILNSIGGLQNLETIGENIHLENLPSLSSMSELQLIDNQLNGYLSLNNTGLQNLQGFHNFQALSGSLVLIGNQYLEQIDLPNLTHLNAGLHLINNALISDFTGLENFEFLGADLILIVNSGLTNLDGLEGLSIIDGDLMITANGPLENLDGLANVELVTDSLIVNYNSNLSICCGIFPSLLHENTGMIIIEGNAPNCGNESEIIVYCSTVDTDEDGIADIDDNCPNIPNSDQTDADLDGFGQVCDCDDNIATVNADAVEIFNNDIDDDCDGEIDEGSPVIPDCSPFSVSISSQIDVSCAGGSDGSIALHFEGATMPMTCDWTHDMGNFQNLQNLSAGNYAVTLTDANGCTTSLSTIISEPDPLTIMTTITDANCDEIDGQVDLSINGGITPYSYTWSHGLGNDEDIQNLPADTYEVTVTDANSCQNTASVIVLEQDCPDFIYFQFTALQVELLPTNEFEIRFSTVGEVETGTFFLEHSINGIDFTSVENQITGNGLGEEENHYAFQHSKPVSGNNFYRIMYLGFDNAVFRSEVKEVMFIGNLNNRIFPNPTSELINVHFEKMIEAPMVVKIYSETGVQILSRDIFEETNLVQLDMRELAPGIYFMRINTENSLLLTERIVKLR